MGFEHHEAYQNIDVALVFILDALNTKAMFEQTPIFLAVTLFLKALAGGCCLPTRRLEKKSKETNGPHIVTKENSRKLYIRSSAFRICEK